MLLCVLLVRSFLLLSNVPLCYIYIYTMICLSTHLLHIWSVSIWGAILNKAVMSISLC